MTARFAYPSRMIRRSGDAWRCRGRDLIAALVLLAIATASAGAASSADPARFASPEQAVKALVAAASANDKAALVRLFGKQATMLVSSGDPIADKAGRKRFVAAYAENNRIERESDAKAVLIVGKNEWPMPIPLVRDGNAWRFDAKSGAEEILNRRIGRNELAAIEVCRAFVDAERDYATQERQHDGLHEYARKFASSPGKHDGLYWAASPHEEQSPMGPLMVEARAEGYAPALRAPYHGYYYKILTRQGPHAPGGAYDYVVKGHLIGGFALVAFPARYGDSGVMTFIVNQDGTVHEKNLGPRTTSLVHAMSAYDPDDSWKTAP
ncbi:MAG TPA: DUF2950 domain-containing protein [Stellaceae bacterium]|nr:DUF2950 domain-containing protein [Stellaceae bacterium]